MAGRVGWFLQDFPHPDPDHRGAPWHHRGTVDAAQRPVGARVPCPDGPTDADPVERGWVDVEHLYPAEYRADGLFPE